MRVSQFIKSFTLAFLGTLLISCGINYEGDNMPNISGLKNKLQTIPQKKWDILKEKKVYFGHKSVGANIMQGIDIVKSEYPAIDFTILETDKAESFINPIWGHSKIGTNTKPLTKIDAFRDILDQGLGNKLDIAFMKLCYVDITEGTDIDMVFNYYTQTIKNLQKKYPRIKFIHFTVPLTSSKQVDVKDRVKDIIKGIIGKRTIMDINLADNIARDKYNGLLKKNYHGKELFDLAAYESMYPDGKKETCQKDGKLYQCLISDYTYDGGHLNGFGKEIIASNLLLFLSELY